MLLDNKFVIITGAKGGLGSDVTAAFLNAGARVAATALQLIDTLNRRERSGSDDGLLSTHFYPSSAERRMFAQRILKWMKPVEAVSSVSEGVPVQLEMEKAFSQ